MSQQNLEAVYKYNTQNLDSDLKTAQQNISDVEHPSLSGPIKQLEQQLKQLPMPRQRKRDKILGKDPRTQHIDQVNNLQKQLNNLREWGAYIDTRILYPNNGITTEQLTKNYQQKINSVLTTLEEFQKYFSKNIEVNNQLQLLISYYREHLEKNPQDLTTENIRIAMITDGDRPRYLQAQHLTTHMGVFDEAKEKTQNHKVGFCKLESDDTQPDQLLFFKFFSTKNNELAQDREAKSLTNAIGNRTISDIDTGTEQARLGITKVLSPHSASNACVAYTKLEFSEQDIAPEEAIMQYSLGMGNMALDELFDLIKEKGSEQFVFDNLADELLASWVAIDTDGKHQNYRASVEFNDTDQKYHVTFHNIDADQTLSNKSTTRTIRQQPLSIQNNFNNVLLLLSLHYPNITTNFDALKAHLQKNGANALYELWLNNLANKEAQHAQFVESHGSIITHGGELVNDMTLANLHHRFYPGVLDGVKKRLAAICDNIQNYENLNDLLKALDPITVAVYQNTLEKRQQNDVLYPELCEENEYNDVITLLYEITKIDAKELNEDSANAVIEKIKNTDNLIGDLNSERSGSSEEKQKAIVELLPRTKATFQAIWKRLYTDDKDVDLTQLVNDEIKQLETYRNYCYGHRDSNGNKPGFLAGCDSDKQMDSSRCYEDNPSRGHKITDDIKIAYNTIANDNDSDHAHLVATGYMQRVHSDSHQAETINYLENASQDQRNQFQHQHASFITLAQFKEYWHSSAHFESIHLERCDQILAELLELDKLTADDKAILDKIIPYTAIKDWDSFVKLYPENNTYLSTLRLFRPQALINELAKLESPSSYQQRVKAYLEYGQQQQQTLDSLLVMFKNYQKLPKSAQSPITLESIKQEINNLDFSHCYNLDANVDGDKQYYNDVVTMLKALPYGNDPIILQNFDRLTLDDFREILAKTNYSQDLGTKALSHIKIYGAQQLITDLNMKNTVGHSSEQLLSQHLTKHQPLSYVINQTAKMPSFIHQSNVTKHLQGFDAVTTNRFVSQDMRLFLENNSRQINGKGQQHFHRARVRILNVQQDLLQDVLKSKSSFINHLSGSDIYFLLSSKNITDANAITILKSKKYCKELTSFCDANPGSYRQLLLKVHAHHGNKSDAYNHLTAAIHSHGSGFLNHFNRSKTHDARITILEQNQNSNNCLKDALTGKEQVNHFTGSDLVYLLLSDDLKHGNFINIWNNKTHRNTLLKHCKEHPGCWEKLLEKQFERYNLHNKVNANGYEASGDEDNRAQPFNRKLSTNSKIELVHTLRLIIATNRSPKLAHDLKTLIANNKDAFTPEMFRAIFNPQLIKVCRNSQTLQAHLSVMFSQLDNKLANIFGIVDPTESKTEKQALQKNTKYLLISNIRIKKDPNSADNQFITTKLTNPGADKDQDIIYLLRHGTPTTQRTVKELVKDKLAELVTSFNGDGNDAQTTCQQIITLLGYYSKSEVAAFFKVNKAELTVQQQALTQAWNSFENKQSEPMQYINDQVQALSAKPQQQASLLRIIGLFCCGGRGKGNNSYVPQNTQKQESESKHVADLGS